MAQIERWMPWCGILVNTDTLETRVDVHRYHGTNIADTLTAELGTHPGAALQEKLLFFLKMKLHPLLYDADINTTHSVGLNMYQIVRLCATKYVCHVKMLPPNRRIAANVGFFSRVALAVVNYPYKRIDVLASQAQFRTARFTLSKHGTGGTRPDARRSTCLNHSRRMQ
eukprot:m.1308134 g.1308134  ORF g.1308134 m.1308134 type:complete len:169 (-) comp24819_c0_seq20:98-604(-)